jgi:hypothetical protein
MIAHSAQIPHNLILSYQYGCRYKGRECPIVTRAGAGIRIRQAKAEIENPERIRFADLLAILSARHHGRRCGGQGRVAAH